jgi:hypothetical protein
MLGRLSAVLATLAWMLALAFLGLSGASLRALAADVPIDPDTIAGGGTPLQMNMSMMLMNNALESWAVGIAAFGVFAVGAVLAILSVESGRRAIRLGAGTGAAAAGATAGGLYLASLVGIVTVAMLG